MSIWCSWPHIGYDPGEGEPAGGQVRTYADGFSNHHPDLTGIHELPAAIHLADIAPWCVTGHNQNGDHYQCTGCDADHDHPEVGTWLRLDVVGEDSLSWWHTADRAANPEHTGPFSTSVVLDEDAAAALHAQLGEWLSRPKVRPHGG